MNWQRGFLRLWCVFALLWIIVGTMLFSPITSYKQMQLTERQARSAEALLEVARNDLEDHTRKTETLSDLSKPVVTAPELARLTANIRRMEALVEEVGKRLDRVRGMLIEYLQLVFIPPVALLILGLLVRWIIRGFTTVRT